MAAKEIKLTIGKDGSTKVEVLTKGLGRECLDLTRFLEKELGAVQERDVKMEEEEPPIDVHMRQG